MSNNLHVIDGYFFFLLSLFKKMFRVHIDTIFLFTKQLILLLITANE